MSHPIHFLSLRKDELVYEVALRGGTSDDTVVDLRKQIVKLSKEMPSETILESHLDAKTDIKETRDSLLRSREQIVSLKAKFENNLYNRTEVLLNHIYHRLNRITAHESDETYRKIKAQLESQLKDLTLIKPTETKSVPETALPNVESPTSVSVTCERSLHTDMNKLRYNGKTCVRAFIQRVEEFLLSRSIPYDKVLTYAYEIFTDDALHWYRYIRESVTTWSELTVRLKADFSKTDYDYRLMSEIRSRTQGEQENISIYISVMHGLFNRLSSPPSEEEKVEILLHNVRPIYASTIAASPSIQTIDALRSICLNYENIQARLTHFHEPPSITSQTLAPDLAYTKNPTTNNQQQSNRNNTQFNQQQTNRNNNQFNQYRNYNKVSAVTTQYDNQNRYPFSCPRCRSNTHDLRYCKQPRTILCFNCGQKDVKSFDCPKCNPNLQSKN